MTTTLHYPLMCFSQYLNNSLSINKEHTIGKKQIVIITCIALAILSFLSAKIINYFLSLSKNKQNSNLPLNNIKNDIANQGVQINEVTPINEATPNNPKGASLPTANQSTVTSHLNKIYQSLFDDDENDLFCDSQSEKDPKGAMQKIEEMIEDLKTKDSQQLDFLYPDKKKKLFPYPKLAFLNLAEVYKFSHLYSQTEDDLKNICENLIFLSKFDALVIVESLKQIDNFLSSEIFSEFYLSEVKKSNFIIFYPLFNFVNQFIPSIIKSNPSLVLNLKLKFANLPLRQINARADFRHLFLTEKEQVYILANHFKTIEMNTIDLVIGKLQSKNIDCETLKRISQFVCKDLLNSINLYKLQTALSSLFGSSISKYKDEKELLKYLSTFFSISSNKKFADDCVNNLYRACKAKKFFEKQLTLDESEIRIPRWYHATPLLNLDYILDPQSHPSNHSIFGPFIPEVEVRHEKSLKGAWVSIQKENFGDSTLAFTHHISLIDPRPEGSKDINKEHRWRGLQKAIPICGVNRPHLVLIGVQHNSYKQNIRKKLESINIKTVMIIKDVQLKFMQNEIVKAIGCPNLTENWWGI